MQEKKERQLQEALLEKQRMQELAEKAIAAYNKSLVSKLFSLLREHDVQQKLERSKFEPPAPPAAVEVEKEEVEEFSFVARAPSVERKYMGFEDVRSTKARQIKLSRQISV